MDCRWRPLQTDPPPAALSIDMMLRIVLFCLIVLPLHAMAEPESESESGHRFMKQQPGNPKAHRAWGITFDYFNMDQPHEVKRLELGSLDGSSTDFSRITASNEVQQVSLKLDYWPIRFLNIFGILGRTDADTMVDFGNGGSVGRLPIAYDGTLYGAGFTLARGGKNWFSSFNATLTEVSMNGDMDSSVRNLTIQPRLGLVKGKITCWISAIYLKTDEQHQGSIDLPGSGAVPISLDLEAKDPWSAAVGMGHVFSPKAMMFVELGLGSRNHFQFSATYRF